MDNKKIESLLKIVDAPVLYEMVYEVNTWDNSLDNLNYIYMEDFDDHVYGDPWEIVNKIYYGSFDPNDDYFTFDGYGNIISYKDWEIEEVLNNNKDEIIKRFVELYERGRVNIWHDEIKNVLDETAEEE